MLSQATDSVALLAAMEVALDALKAGKSADEVGRILAEQDGAKFLANLASTATHEAKKLAQEQTVENRRKRAEEVMVALNLPSHISADTLAKLLDNGVAAIHIALPLRNDDGTLRGEVRAEAIIPRQVGKAANSIGGTGSRVVAGDGWKVADYYAAIGGGKGSDIDTKYRQAAAQVAPDYVKASGKWAMVSVATVGEKLHWRWQRHIATLLKAGLTHEQAIAKLTGASRKGSLAGVSKAQEPTA